MQRTVHTTKLYGYSIHSNDKIATGPKPDGNLYILKTN